MAYKEPKILGLLPHWHIRTKSEASWYPERGSSRYKYMIAARSPMHGGDWEAWVFLPDAATGVRISGTVHYHAYKAADEAEADWRARGIAGASNRESNRARSPARSRLGKRTLPKATETRVASLHQILDRVPTSDAFLTVKAGRIYARYRKAGRGLGKASLVGHLPGFKRGLFYFVRDGVVYARRRK